MVAESLKTKIKTFPYDIQYKEHKITVSHELHDGEFLYVTRIDKLPDCIDYHENESSAILLAEDSIDTTLDIFNSK